mmetsp:Transcript_26973/g.65583  ORF Transcript_26973/g.65583 Transcript_26973/m.65583 type:complete len:325 (-) Transcript_26973:72-1046(-)
MGWRQLRGMSKINNMLILSAATLATFRVTLAHAATRIPVRGSIATRNSRMGNRVPGRTLPCNTAAWNSLTTTSSSKWHMLPRGCNRYPLQSKGGSAGTRAICTCGCRHGGASPRTQAPKHTHTTDPIGGGGSGAGRSLQPAVWGPRAHEVEPLAPLHDNQVLDAYQHDSHVDTGEQPLPIRDGRGGLPFRPPKRRLRDRQRAGWTQPPNATRHLEVAQACLVGRRGPRQRRLFHQRHCVSQQRLEVDGLPSARTAPHRLPPREQPRDERVELRPDMLGPLPLLLLSLRCQALLLTIGGPFSTSASRAAPPRRTCGPCFRSRAGL